MGFKNTQYTDTVSNLVKATTNKFNNPYYKFSDKKPTEVVYYKQNIKKSTLDEGSALQYAHVSNQSALKYNKIIGFFLYGIGQINVEYDVGDNGLEATPISGEAVVLPNTIEPTDGDFFSIPYIKEDVLFKVDSVSPDTLDTGATLYRIEYHLELTNSKSQIEKQVDKSYNFIVDNVGTEFNSVIRSTDYELAQKLEDMIEELSNLYNGIFFKSRVQSYIYLYENVWNFYDPYMIEFIRRNKLISSNGNATYVAHQIPTEVTFPYEYSKSIFYGIETRNKKLVCEGNIAVADLITDINSLFTSRIENYYRIRYMDSEVYKTRFGILDKELIDAIKVNYKFPEGDKRSYYNIIVSYMNNDTGYINGSIIDEIHKMDYTDNKTIFYMIPFYIFIIKEFIKSNILSTKTLN